MRPLMWNIKLLDDHKHSSTLLSDEARSNMLHGLKVKSSSDNQNVLQLKYVSPFVHCVSIMLQSEKAFQPFPVFIETIISEEAQWCQFLLISQEWFNDAASVCWSPNLQTIHWFPSLQSAFGSLQFYGNELTAGTVMDNLSAAGQVS